MTRGKTGVKHHTGVGPETLQLLKVYFDEKYGEGNVPGDEDLIFEMQRRPIDEIYADRAHKMLGNWPHNNPLGIHNKRKAFRKQVVNVGGCPSEFAEYFMGHHLKGDIEKTYSMSYEAMYVKFCVPNLHFEILPYSAVKKQFKL